MGERRGKRGKEGWKGEGRNGNLSYSVPMSVLPLSPYTEKNLLVLCVAFGDFIPEIRIFEPLLY